MELTSLVGFGMVAALLAIVLGQYRSEYRMLLTLGAGTVMLFAIVHWLQPVLEQLHEIFSYTNMPMAYVQVLLKALGVCFITQLAADVCRDAGEGSIASKIELGGKAAVLALSLPLFAEILSIASKLIAL